MDNKNFTENKDDQMPVFKSDIMTSQEELISPITSVSSVGSISPVSGISSSFDSIGVWRYMSEKYRNKRLENEKRQQMPVNNLLYNRIDPNQTFQGNYEYDTTNFSSQRDHLPWQDDMLKKIWQAQLPIDFTSVEITKDEAYEHPNDGILRVSDVMTKDVISVMDSTTIEQVVNIFNKHRIHSAPVINYQNKYLMGIITSTDILTHIFDQKSISTFHTDGSFFKQDSLGILEKPVSEYMKTTVIQVPVDYSIKQTCKVMIENNIHRVIVTKNNRVKGIFSASDAVKILESL